MKKVVIFNAVTCTICESPATRIGGPEKVTSKDHPSGWHFQYQANPGHKADGFTGIFSNLTWV